MQHEQPHMEDKKPPVLGSWRNLYLLVLGALVLQIIIYYGITRYFE